MAKDLVRTRQHITKFYTLKSHLQGVSLRMQVEHTAIFFKNYIAKHSCRLFNRSRQWLRQCEELPR